MAPSSLCVLERPKYVQNLAAAVRACACFDIKTLIWTGSRFDLSQLDRTPRELRMKDYKTVTVTNTNRPFELLPPYIVPVCVDLLPGAIPLDQFEHPVNAAYVFGPEDGSVSQVYRRLCHKFVYIPSKFCLNLAAAMNVVLYDRQRSLYDQSPITKSSARHRV